MSFGEQMKQKADEVHLQRKAKDFGDAVAELAKAAVGIAAGYASQNRPKVDSMLDKAEQTIDARTGGKHAQTVTKVRASVDKGIDRLVEQQGPGGRSGGATPSRPTAPPSQVPDDTTSAFDDAASGSPS